MKSISNLNNWNKFLFRFIFLLFITSYCSYSQPAAWQSFGPGGGGAFYCPQINPVNPKEFYVSSDMSDLFHTTDFGNSYSIVHFKYITSGSMTNVQFTNDPKILYTINQNEFGNYPVKSTDGGVTWNKLKVDPTSGGAYFLFADDENFNKILVADYTNIYYSTDGGSTYTTIFKGNSGTWGSYIAGVLWDGNDTYICLADEIGRAHV